jgi:pimeloyl-ACP methyl ester carboxylesterase
LLLGVATVPGLAAQSPNDANCRTWPAVSGRYPVGTLDFELTDSSRTAHYAPQPTGHRRIYVRAWYPAAEVGSLPRRTYFTAPEVTVLPAKLLGLLQQPPDALRRCATLLTNSYQEAPPAAGRFPVVGFNHGYTSYPGQQTALFEHLATHGYVVLSLGHPYESGGIVYPNGDVATLAPSILADLGKVGRFQRTAALYFSTDVNERLRLQTQYVKGLRAGSLGRLASVWRDDVYFVLDRLEDSAVPTGAHGLAKIIDHDRRAHMGMSYGGYLAAMLAQGDRRAKAAVELDGGSWTDELIDTEVRTPMLALKSDAIRAFGPMADSLDATMYRGPLGPLTPTSSDLAYERIATAGQRDDVFRIAVPGILHLGVSDNVELFGAPALRPLVGDSTAAARFTTVQNDLVRGFLDRYVKGEANGFPGAVLRAHPDLVVRDRAAIRTGGRPEAGRGSEGIREQVRTVLQDIGRIVAPNGIDETRIIRLGGVNQWIMLRGQDRAAPILLFLHGGPGSPISSIVYAYQRPWEDFFLVVHWDQRGFGRSRGTPADSVRLKGTLNRRQYRADAIELIERLRGEFGQRRVVLVGQSWGTVLALEVAHERPDLLHAVVTQGLAANWLGSPRLLYQHLLAQAAATGDTAEAARLGTLGPLPPVDQPLELLAWARRLGVGFPDSNTWHNIRGPGDSWARRIEGLELVSPDYSAEEFAAAHRDSSRAAIGYYQEAMSSVLGWDAERDVGTRLAVPLIVMQGTHDWQTSRDLAKAYFDKICAPYKVWVEFPHAAHALNIEQPGLAAAALVNEVLPAVRGEIPRGATTCRAASP